MANDFSSNPIVVDTAYSTGDVVSKTNVFIRSAIWEGPTTVGHQLIVQDRNGKQIAAELCSTANENVSLIYLNGWFNGLKVTQIDSGKLFIYL